ncbi:MAG TPA: RNA methyltransferase [Patescibacteria group bacterium]|nr:RNA methyltransferase [Patescibacteria group bacterium]|tara:strand:+ start:129 stop:794 length:666 start_codon:yes stop_codon:yes gene_type:complete
MLSDIKVKMIRSLKTKKGREKHGLCLVEGQKLIDAAGDAVDFTFSREDRMDFEDFMTTETPQGIAGIAKIPKFTIDEVAASSTVVVLDGVQDPGNVGTILRLCQGFGASLILIESVDVTNSKVIRASAGAMFHVPWVTVARPEAVALLEGLKKPIYKMEVGGEGSLIPVEPNAILIAGSEGQGITLDIKGESVTIQHDAKLESLNVANALAIVLYGRFNAS